MKNVKLVENRYFGTQFEILAILLEIFGNLENFHVTKVT